VRLTGTRVIRAPREAVWAFLMAPDRLRRCLPGCERFEAAGPDRFAATLRLGVAFLTGTYDGTLRIVEQRHPERLTLLVEGGGSLGSLVAAGTITFTDAGGTTRVAYDGDAAVRGAVAAVGERVMAATADRLIAAFFHCVASSVEG
jgi:YD repeat-containing protein